LAVALYIKCSAHHHKPITVFVLHFAYVDAYIDTPAP